MVDVIPDWALGQLIAVVSCLSASLGLLFFKESADVEAHLPLIKRWRWFVGFGFILLNGLILDPITFALAPLSLIAPMAGLTMVITVLLVIAYRGERLSRRDGGCLAMVLIGIILVALCGPHPLSEPPLSQMAGFARNPQFLAFACTSLLTVALNLALGHSPCLIRFRPAPCSFAWMLLSAYAAASCGGLTQISLKIVATGVRAAVETDALAPLRAPVVPLALLALAACAPLQLYLLHATLTSSPVKHAVPVYQALLTLLSSAAGGVFFAEFARIPAGALLGFGAGISTIIGGIAALSMGQGVVSRTSDSMQAGDVGAGRAAVATADGLADDGRRRRYTPTPTRENGALLAKGPAPML